MPKAWAWSEEAWETDSFRRIGRRTRKDGTFVDVELLAVRVSHDTYYILYHDVTELERAPTAADPGRRAARRARPHRRARRFLPRQVAGGLLAGQLRAEKPFERRRITILSADMVGFTDLSETLEPEELSEVLNGYLRPDNRGRRRPRRHARQKGLRRK